MSYLSRIRELESQPATGQDGPAKAATTQRHALGLARSNDGESLDAVAFVLRELRTHLPGHLARLGDAALARLVCWALGVAAQRTILAWRLRDPAELRLSPAVAEAVAEVLAALGALADERVWTAPSTGDVSNDGA